MNIHLCHHLTPVMRGPAGRLLSLWMTWMLAMINPLLRQPWTFWVETGLWVVSETRPGQDQCWVSRGYILSRGYRHQSCHLERGKRRLDRACSWATPGNPERCRQICTVMSEPYDLKINILNNFEVNILLLNKHSRPVPHWVLTLASGSLVELWSPWLAGLVNQRTSLNPGSAHIPAWWKTRLRNIVYF